MVGRILKHSLLIFFAFFSISACAYNDTVRSSLIGFSEFREIQNNLYVSPTIDYRQDQAIIANVSDARTRIKRHYGKVASNPRIIVANGENEKKQFKLYGVPGKLLIAPWGNYVILDNEQRSVDVIAHELVHAEIAGQLGYYKRMTGFPTWLDEGLALQVDYRPKYSLLPSIEKSEYNRITSLTKPSIFWSENREQNIKNYQGAKAAVSIAVIPLIEKEGLYEFLKKYSQESTLSNSLKYEN